MNTLEGLAQFFCNLFALFLAVFKTIAIIYVAVLLIIGALEFGGLAGLAGVILIIIFALWMLYDTWNTYGEHVRSCENVRVPIPNFGPGIVPVTTGGGAGGFDFGRLINMVQTCVEAKALLADLQQTLDNLMAELETARQALRQAVIQLAIATATLIATITAVVIAGFTSPWSIPAAITAVAAATAALAITFSMLASAAAVISAIKLAIEEMENALQQAQDLIRQLCEGPGNTTPPSPNIPTVTPGTLPGGLASS